MAVVPDVDRKVVAALRRARLVGSGATLVVGVSGGADSSTLLYSLNRLRESCEIQLHVAHLNHDFRGEEAEEDARFVAALAEELGLPVSVEKRDPIAYQKEQGISSFEQGARQMRYEFMASVADRVGASVAAVGHTSDDLAETVLLHILRGTGLPGLRGMAEIASWPWPAGLESPTLFRPLLEVTKAETIAYCRELGRSYRQDSGNTLFRFTRNRVRQELMPFLAAEFNPQAREALVRLAHTSALELDYLEQELDRIWPDLEVSPGQGGYVANAVPAPAVKLSRDVLAKLHPALRRMALRRAYVAIKGDPRRLGEIHLKAMSNLVEGSKSNGALSLPSGVVLQMAGEEVLLTRLGEEEYCPLPALRGNHAVAFSDVPGFNAVHKAGEWQVRVEIMASNQLSSLKPPNGYTAFLNLDVLGNRLTVRTRQPGDRFQPLGMGSEKKLQDFLVDAKVPRPWRDRIPLVIAEERIAWVVGHRIAEWSKVPEIRSGGAGKQCAAPDLCAG